LTCSFSNLVSSQTCAIDAQLLKQFHGTRVELQAHVIADLSALQDRTGLVDPDGVIPVSHAAGVLREPRVPPIPEPQFKPVKPGTDDFKLIESRLEQNADWSASYHKIRHPDYLDIRIELVSAEAVRYGPTRARFQQHLAERRSEGACVSTSVVFHGCRALNVGTMDAQTEVKDGLARRGVVPAGMSQSKTTDDGWFGDNKKGVYVAKNLKYCLKYANPAGWKPVCAGETVKVLMLELLPGKVKEMSRRQPGCPPTPNYDCHLSCDSKQEFYVYDPSVTTPGAEICPPRQLLLTHILEVKLHKEIVVNLAEDDGA
jgi:hypothetical protein